MVLHPICEPIELPVHAMVIAERVIVAEDADEIGSFMHFHDVAELVLFRSARGEFIVDGQRHELREGSIVFIPSMRHHDYRLERGAMEWLLVQIDPYIVENLAFRTGIGALTRPRCAIPDEVACSRIAMLGEWLFEATRTTTPVAAVERIVELLLLAIAEIPLDAGVPLEHSPAHPERLFQALERLRTAPDQPLTLECAASLCSLSPTYFSRRFRQLFGMTFSAYARTYRLHLAARRLLATGQSVSEICFGVGFTSPAHFSARFRERFGMTPREYRANARVQRCTGEGS